MSLRRLILSSVRALGFDIKRHTPRYHEQCVSLIPEGSGIPRGNVLLAYRLEAFLLEPGQPVPTDHTNRLESVLMARTFQQLGYAVDAIDFRNAEFHPRKDYAVFVSARTNLEHIAARLNPDCLKIAHLDTAHFLFNNRAAYSRALSLQQRRGVTCTSIRLIEHNLAIEHADYGVVLGGEFSLSTYRYANKPLLPIPLPTIHAYPFQESKNYHACRKRFVWFGSSGAVHKGLDLLLEAFAEMPEYELVVCGPIANEQEFRRIYARELYETANIQTVGWVDTSSDEFLKIMHSCVGVVFPSCSEGQSGSVLTCMRAGLIPVVSYESGIDVRNFGILLKECTVSEIRRAVEDLADRPVPELRKTSRDAWEYTQKNHTPEKYAAEYRHIIERILTERGIRV